MHACVHGYAELSTVSEAAVFDTDFLNPHRVMWWAFADFPTVFCVDGEGLGGLLLVFASAGVLPLVPCMVLREYADDKDSMSCGPG
jgi:hypothetical protein